jgi:hypothetical protein
VIRPLRYKGHSANTYHALVHSAWLEWRLNASARGVPLDALEVRPPGWFAREELGFAFEHGPSLNWTLSTLVLANLRAIKQLGREAPYRVSYPPHNPKTRDPLPRRSDRLRPAKRRRGRGVAVPF